VERDPRWEKVTGGSMTHEDMEDVVTVVVEVEYDGQVYTAKKAYSPTAMERAKGQKWDLYKYFMNEILRDLQRYIR